MKSSGLLIVAAAAMITALVATPVRAYHDYFSHTVVLCTQIDDIIIIATTLRTTSKAPQITGPCKVFKIALRAGDMENMTPLAAPAKDYQGDWYAPFSIRTRSGTTYTILYSGKGNKDFRPIDRAPGTLKKDMKQEV